MIEKTAAILKALGEPTRLKIVKFLSIQELCVCELEAILGMSQPRVSQHLRVLKQAGIVKERKERQKSYFSLVFDILDRARIPTWEVFMTVNAADIAELGPELTRFRELDSNEKVNACKQGHTLPGRISMIG
ncbi:MAG: ArsR/SmtB family transcription factor [Deltaproteobacteria bacterium]